MTDQSPTPRRLTLGRPAFLNEPYLATITFLNGTTRNFGFAERVDEGAHTVLLKSREGSTLLVNTAAVQTIELGHYVD